MTVEFRAHSGRGLREIVSPAEKVSLPAVLAAWGYVRAVPALELELGVWFAYGDDGVFWLVRDAEWEAGDEAQLHLCAAPAAQGRIASRWALTAIEVVACLLDLRELHAPVREEWAPLLHRFGWVPAPEITAPLGPHAIGWWRRSLPPRPLTHTAASAAGETALRNAHESRGTDGRTAAADGDDGCGPGADARGTAE